MADALISQPSILILDEPTIGLDPHQIRHTRELIQRVGQRATILLSTHILPEVEMICQRVTIIDKGRIVAIDTPDNLRRRMAGTQLIRVEVRAEDPAVEQALGQLAGVSRVVRQSAAKVLSSGGVPVGGGVPEGGEEGNGVAVFDVEATADVREAIFRLAVERRWTLRQLASAQMSLEDIFIRLTTQEVDA